MDYGKFEQSLRKLKQQHEHWQKHDDTLPVFLQEALAESVIQRFETAYDCLWKVLKRHLIEVLGLPEVPNSPKPVFRLANENALLPGSVEDWLRYANARVDTAHDYSGEKAGKALALMGDFISHAQALFQRLTSKAWHD